MKCSTWIAGALVAASSLAIASPETPETLSSGRLMLAQAAPATESGTKAGTGRQATGGQGQEADASKLDRKFAQQAAEANAIEIQSSEMAMEKATDPKVKEYAKRMVDQHSKANEELLGIINATIPEKWRPLKEMPAERKKEMTSLEKLSGEQFDRKYMSMMAKSHQRAVKLYENEIKNGKNEQLKAYAEKTLPAIKEHTQMAKSMSSQGNTSSGK